jgi:hypothetical protein
LVEKDPTSFLFWAKLNSEQLTLYSVLESAILNGHVIKDGHQYNFLGEPIGFSKQDAVDYLSKKEHQPIKLKLLELANK